MMKHSLYPKRESLLYNGPLLKNYMATEKRNMDKDVKIIEQYQMQYFPV